MALGEYVSVSSQRDSEQADIAREVGEIATLPAREQAELKAIYEAKGLPPELASVVAEELSKHDALAVHLAEELGITDASLARPVEAAVSSAGSFAVGGAIPLVCAAVVGGSARIVVTIVVVVVALAVLGAVGATAGGARPARPVVRVVVGGILAMAFTMGVGKLFGAAVG